MDNNCYDFCKVRDLTILQYLYIYIYIYIEREREREREREGVYICLEHIPELDGESSYNVMAPYNSLLKCRKGTVKSFPKFI